MKEKYTPVSCSFVDRIEIAATEGRTGVVEYLKDGVPQTDEMTILSWKTENSEEFLISKEGHKIRLDHIITLLGQAGPGADESC